MLQKWCLDFFYGDHNFHFEMDPMNDSVVVEVVVIVVVTCIALWFHKINCSIHCTCVDIWNRIKYNKCCNKINVLFYFITAFISLQLI